MCSVVKGSTSTWLAERRFLCEQITSPLNRYSRSHCLQHLADSRECYSGFSRCNLSVSCKLGCEMLLADHFSRAAEQEITKPEDSFQVFSVELENTSPMQALKLSPERLEQLQRCTGQDAALQILKTTILTGLPTQKEQVPINIIEFWNYR